MRANDILIRLAAVVALLATAGKIQAQQINAVKPDRAPAPLARQLIMPGAGIQRADRWHARAILGTPVSLCLVNVTVAEALKILADTAGVDIAFDARAVAAGPPVSLDVVDRALGEVIRTILDGRGFRFVVSRGGQVVIIASPSRSRHDMPQMRGSVSGVVTGIHDAPLAGAAVAVAGTSRASLTDANGHFSISGVPAGNRQIRASFAGYGEKVMPIEIRADRTVTTKVRLIARAVQVDAVVAIGYGSVLKKDLTGSVGTVTAEAIRSQAAPSVSITNVLAGRTPGLRLVTSDGTPGSAAVVRIRGSHSINASSAPLYVIDGIPIGDIPLSSIDPSNIESVQILKDASATAIYGARGSNGVVLIATKRGTPGINQVTAQTSYGIQRPTKFIEALDARQFRRLSNEARVNVGLLPRYTPAEIESATTYDYPYHLLNDLEWQPRVADAVTISGGDDDTRYLLSGNYLDQSGLVLNSGYTRYGVRLNLDQMITSRLRVGASLSGTRSRQELNGSNDTGSGSSNIGVTTAIEYDPAVTPRDPETGEWNQLVALSENFTNPITEAVNRRGANYNTTLLTSLYGEFDITDRLLLRSTLGGTFDFERDKSFSPSYIRSGNELGTARQISGERRELTNENTLTWTEELGPGTLEALVGASVQASHFESFSAEARGFPADQLSFHDLSAGSILIAPTSTDSNTLLLSQLGRLNYNLLDRYLFTVTGRRDGSSRFGANNKWAFFPSAAFAWRVIDEEIMRRQSLFSDLKLRLSYGRTGNQAISPYQSLAHLRPVFFSHGTGDDAVVLAPSDEMSNPDLKWETQDQYDIGMDLGFLSNRIGLTVDVYQSNTSNLLLNTKVPWTTGFRTQLRNVGAVKNRGAEVALTTLNYVGEKFTWRTSLNISRNHNEVTTLYDDLDELGVGSSTQVGEPLNTFVGYKVLGLWSIQDSISGACPFTPAECRPGEYRILDADGNGMINDDDRVNLGNAEADFHGGFSSAMSYGPLSLDLFFSFSKGNFINEQPALRYAGLVAGASNERAARALRRWTPENQDTDVPRANINRPSNRTYSSYISDGSFLRLQSLSLGCDIPPRFLPDGYLDAARVVITGQNLWITTKYDGWDPENAVNGIDSGGYPRARTWDLSLSATF